MYAPNEMAPASATVNAKLTRPSISITHRDTRFAATLMRLFKILSK